MPEVTCAMGWGLKLGVVMPKPHFSPYGTRLILGKSSEGKDRVGETFSGLQGGTPCECALRSDCLRPSKSPSPSDPWISHQQKPMPGPRLQAGEWSGDDAPVCRHPLLLILLLPTTTVGGGSQTLTCIRNIWKCKLQGPRGLIHRDCAQ